MKEEQEDYSKYVELGSSDALAKLQKLAEDQAAAEQLVIQQEAELEKAKEHLKDLAENQIPELMESVGMKEFKTTSGLVISLKEAVRASIPEARQIEAFNWLRKNGHAALIRRVVSVAFGRGEDQIAAALLEELRGKKKLEAEDKQSVHPSTLGAFVREQLREGKDIPEDLFGIFRQNVSKITLPKSKG